MHEEIKKRINAVKHKIDSACTDSNRDISLVKLVTVTKTHPIEILQAVLDSGCIDIGENKVQEIETKIPTLKGDKIVHFIGSLQSNKVSKVVPLADWIHSLDREKIIWKVEHYCEKLNKNLNVLVQVNTSLEDAKSGCELTDTRKLCELICKMPHLDLKGLMTIGPLFGNNDDVRRSFVKLRELGDNCSDLVNGNIELSMGMSNDFVMAIEEGSTIVRIGSSILGNRSYL